MNLKLKTDKNKNNDNKDTESLLKNDKVKKEIDKLILARFNQIIPDNPKNKDKRKLFLGGLMGGIGDAVGGITGGIGDAVGGITDSLSGGAGVGLGAAAAGAGMMAKQQREKEHHYALMRVENEMAAAQFSADFQDQAIMELSRIVGRGNYVDGRLKTIHTTLDYSLNQMITTFMLMLE